MMAYIAIVRALIKRIPAWAYIALALLAVWYIDRTRYGHHRAYEARSEMQAIIDRKEAERAKALASEEQALRQLAKETDRDVIQNRAAERNSTERFIAAGGVRQACPGDRITGNRSAGDSAPVHQAPVMDDPQPVQVVGVTADDVRVCTDNTLTAEGLRAFVLGLEKRP